MNKVVKLLVVSVLVVLLIGVLVACNESTTQDISKPMPDGVIGGGSSSGNGGGGNNGGGTEDTDPGTPAYLTFSYKTQAPSVFKHIYVDEFELSNVLYHVNYCKEVGETKVYTEEEEGHPLTVDMLDSASKKAISVAGHHQIFVSLTVDGKKINGAFSLHLKDRANTELVEITFNLDGGEAQFGTVADGAATAKVQKGATFTWSELIAEFPVSKTGYALNGWKKGSTAYNSASDEIKFDSNTTLTADWTNAYIGITFDINLPEGVDSWAPATENSLPAGAESGTWTTNAVRNDGVATRPNANDINTLAGYAFVGWNTAADKSGEVWNFNSKVGSNDFTLYAMWEIRSYSVTYYLMGGEFKNESIATDDKTQLSVEVSYANGYHEGDEDYDPNYTQNLLTDKPFKVVLSGIEYGADLGDFYSTFAITNGSKKSINASADPETLKSQLVKGLIDDVSSYEVVGWYTSQSYSDDTLYTGEAITGDLELYAKWSLKDGLSEAHKESYFKEYLYNYTVKGDGTVRIDKVRDSAVSELVVPNEIDGHIVSEIGANAGMNLLSLNVIDASATTGLTTIGASAFASCASLREIKHPATSKIENIGKDAFVSTEWLNTYAERHDGSQFVTLGTVLIGYVGDSSVTTLDISSLSGITVIAPYAFQKLSDLETIVLGDEVKTIGEYAFYNDKKLATVSGGDNLEYIASSAFETTAFFSTTPADDPDTADVDESTYLRIGSIFYRFLASASAKAVIPSGIKVIAPNAFYGANNLVEIKFIDASQIEKVDASAFTSTKWIRSEIGTESTGHAGTFIKDGFVVINYTLVNYTGHSTIISIPEEVKKIASKAFVSSSAKIANVIIPAGASLELVESEAFYGMTYLKAISFLDTTVNFPTVENSAFSADGEIVGSDLKFYFYKAPYDQLKTASGSSIAVADGDSDALKSWKAVAGSDITRIQRLATESATFASNVPVQYLRGVSALDFEAAWAAAGILSSDGQYILDGAVVRRSDGVLRTENLPVASIVYESNAGDKGAHSLTFKVGGGVKADGTDYDVVSSELAYDVYMAIDQSTIAFYHTDDNGDQVAGVPTFYTTQTSLPTKGLGISFKYVDGTADSLPLDDEQITVTGYSAQRDSGKTLRIDVDYHDGLASYVAVFSYNVNEPKNKSIKPISALSLSVNSNATSQYASTSLLVVMDDGRECVVNLNNVSIISKTDAENKNVNASVLSGLDTTELGYHTAGVRYGDAAKGYVFSTLIYSVTLDTDANAFTYRIVDKIGKTAVITGLKSAYANQTTIAIPSKARLNANGYYASDSNAQNVGDYTIVGIGDQAFKNNTKVQYVYIPSSATSIGEESFMGCTALKQVRSFDIKGELTSSSIGIDSVRITEETVNYEGTVTITGVANVTLDAVIPVAFTETIYKDGEGTDGCDLVEVWTRKVLLASDALSLVEGEIKLPDTEYYREYAEANLEGKKVTFYSVTTSVSASVEKYVFANYDAPEELVATATGKATIVTNARITLVDGLILIPAYIQSDADNIARTYTVTAFDEGAFALAPADCDEFCLPNCIETYNGSLENLFGTGVSYYSKESFVYNVSDDYIYAPANHFSATVKTIGDRAFKGCVSLGKIVREGDVVTEDNTIDFTSSVVLEEIGMNAFDGCIAIETIDLSNTLVEEISDGAFMGCTALVSVALPAVTETIGNNAFNGCVELTAVTGMNNVTFIGSYAFKSCVKLTVAYIPENVPAGRVGIGAFDDTQSATTVYVLGKAVAESMKYGSNTTNVGGIISDRDVVYVTSDATVTDSGFLSNYEVSGEATTVTVDGVEYSVIKYVKKA